MPSSSWNCFWNWGSLPFPSLNCPAGKKGKGTNSQSRPLLRDGLGGPATPRGKDKCGKTPEVSIDTDGEEILRQNFRPRREWKKEAHQNHSITASRKRSGGFWESKKAAMCEGRESAKGGTQNGKTVIQDGIPEKRLNGADMAFVYDRKKVKEGENSSNINLSRRGIHRLLVWLSKKTGVPAKTGPERGRGGSTGGETQSLLGERNARSPCSRAQKLCR